MQHYEPDAELFATRRAVERWLIEHGRHAGSDASLTANNLTLWASTFVNITKDEAAAASRRLRRQGALDFVAQVSHTSAGRIIEDHVTDPLAITGSAFHDEAVKLLVDTAIEPNRADPAERQARRASDVTAS